MERLDTIEQLNTASAVENTFEESKVANGTNSELIREP